MMKWREEFTCRVGSNPKSSREDGASNKFIGLIAE